MGLNPKIISSIKLLILDVDGVMTDSRVFYDNGGEWRRMFNIRDGMGIVRLHMAGYKTAVITGSNAEDIRARVKRLGIHYFHEGKVEKLPAYEQVKQESGMTDDEICYVGDDFFDIPVLEKVKFAATVADAEKEVVDMVHFVTENKGGFGAVREICNLIYKYGAYAK